MVNVSMEVRLYEAQKLFDTIKANINQQSQQNNKAAGQRARVACNKLRHKLAELRDASIKRSK